MAADLTRRNNDATKNSGPAAVRRTAARRACGLRQEKWHGDTSGDKAVNGTETKNDADSQLTAKYVYQAQYLELPVKTSYIDDSAVSGDTLFFYAQVQDESYAAANSDTPAEGRSTTPPSASC